MNCPSCHRDYHPREGPTCLKCFGAEKTTDAPALALREPLRRAYSRPEIVEAMNQWMLETHGHPMQLEEETRDRWYRDNGMLHAFLCARFPA